MLKYAIVVDEKTKRCAVGLEDPEKMYDDTMTYAEYYQSIGMGLIEIEQAYSGQWYLEGYAPEEPSPTYEEQKQRRAEAYRQEKDPITCQIESLRDEEQTPEVKEEIEKLKQERAKVVEDIQNRYPYPEES